MKPFVVVVFGASGSGKSTLLELLNAAGRQYSIHVKATDRPPRQYDDIEIKCVSQVNSSEYEYIYQTYGHRYGIQRRQIDAALSEGRHHFIICNDIQVICALKRDYGSAIRVVLHTFDAPRDALRKIQEDRGISDDEIELRLAKTTSLYRTYIENRELFDDVISNHFGEDTRALKVRMERILLNFALQRESGVADQLMHRLDEFTAQFEERLIAYEEAREDTFEPGYVFIVMAMFEDDLRLEDVHETIRRACRDLGLRGERVDDIQFTGQITEKIQSSIRLAELVVADLTHERPNVYYEVGFANAYDKPLILIADNEARNRVHFDLQGHKILFFKNMTDLHEKLRRALAALRQVQ